MLSRLPEPLCGGPAEGPGNTRASLLAFTWDKGLWRQKKGPVNHRCCSVRAVTDIKNGRATTTGGEMWGDSRGNSSYR